MAAIQYRSPSHLSWMSPPTLFCTHQEICHHPRLELQGTWLQGAWKREGDSVLLCLTSCCFKAQWVSELWKIKTTILWHFLVVWRAVWVLDEQCSFYSHCIESLRVIGRTKCTVACQWERGWEVMCVQVDLESVVRAIWAVWTKQHIIHATQYTYTVYIHFVYHACLCKII